MAELWKLLGQNKDQLSLVGSAVSASVLAIWALYKYLVSSKRNNSPPSNSNQTPESHSGQNDGDAPRYTSIVTTHVEEALVALFRGIASLPGCFILLVIISLPIHLLIVLLGLQKSEAFITFFCLAPGCAGYMATSEDQFRRNKFRSYFIGLSMGIIVSVVIAFRLKTASSHTMDDAQHIIIFSLASGSVFGLIGAGLHDRT